MQSKVNKNLKVQNSNINQERQVQKKMDKYRQAVFVVTYAEEKGKTYYLILKRRHHWKGWEFPKGGINSGEKKRKLRGER